MKRPNKQIYLILILVLITFAGSSIHAQKLGRWDKRQWRKNIIWLEGMGASGVVGVHYERVFMLGRAFSLRADVGVSPFYVSDRFELYAGKSMTAIVGGGFYVFPNAFKIGIGCSMLNDFFFDRIPETVPPAITDSTHTGPIDAVAPKNYKVRIMPYLVVEGTVANRVIFRAGYSPIIDPDNDLQTETTFMHWATISVGYKFGK